MSSAALLFRVVYTTFYVFLHLVLLIFLAVTPTDFIYQSLSNSPETFFVVVISVSYCVTIAIIIFVYSTRLYVNRSVLASIPKSWIPIDKGDLPKAVRKMIITGLSRSAAIAFDARPRVPPPPMMRMTATGTMIGPEQAGQLRKMEVLKEQDEGEGDGAVDSRKKRRTAILSFLSLKKTTTIGHELGIILPPHKAVWGEIEHNGWGSPLSPDFPDLQYDTVISELPNLIEAKAMTLAPPLPPLTPVTTSSQGGDGAGEAGQRQQSGILDPEAVEVLQRGNMALRDYLANLATLGVLPPSPTVAEFLAAYEHARFSARAVSARRFRDLMQLFAELLRSMAPLNPAALYGDGGNDYNGQDNSEADDGRSNYHTGLRGREDDYDGQVGSSPDQRPAYSSDIDNDAPAGTNTPTTLGSAEWNGASQLSPSNPHHNSLQREGENPPHSNGHRRSSSPTAGSVRTVKTTDSGSSGGSSGSQIRHHPRALTRNSSSHTWHQQYRTAPTTPKSHHRHRHHAHRGNSMAAAGSPGTNSTSSTASTIDSGDLSEGRFFAQTRHPFPISQHASSGSLRSLASSNGSVVRLRER